MIRTLRKVGLKSDFLYGAALASIVASIGAWATSRSKEDASAAKAERWGIFVGLWAPTFMGVGNALKVEEK
jgi:hypothetical protein